MVTILPEEYKAEIEKIESMKNVEVIIEHLQDLADKAYEAKEKMVGTEMQRLTEKMLMLRSIDNLWIEHLTLIEELRQGIGLRGYGQRDPLTEYKREAFNMFERLIATIYEEVIHLILKVELSQAPTSAPSTVEGSGVIMKGGAESDAAGTFSQITNPKMQDTKNNQIQNSKSVRKVGRNEPCPCGAKKPDGRPVKYKYCHGR
jgi:preprotein translocase subunit SecA